MYLNADRSGLTSGLAAGEADAQNWATKIKGLAMGVSLAFVGVGIAAVNASTELNEKMGNVESLGVALERVEELKAGVQDLSIEYGKGTESMAETTYEVVSALGDTATTLDTVELSAKTAAAGLADPKEAFGLLVAVTKAYGDTSQESMTKVADLAFQAVNLGQTTFPELAASIGAVTPMAVALGVSQEELFAQLAALTGVTGSTSEVTTQLRATYQAILKPTGDMAEALAVVAGQLEEQGKLTAGPMVDGWRAATETHEQAIAKLTEMRTEFEQVEGAIGATDATTATYKAELDRLRLTTEEQELALRGQLLALDENTESGKAQATVIRDQIAQLKLDSQERELAIETQMMASGTSSDLSERYKELKLAIKDQEDAVKSSSDAVEEQSAALGGAIVEAVGVNEALTMLTETTGGNTNEIGKMFGSVEALNAVLALSGSQSDSYDAKLNAMKDSSGALDAAFRAQTEGINANGFTMEQVAAKAEVLMQKLGDGLAPAVSKVLGMATPLIDRLISAADWFANADTETQTWILSIGGLLAVMGPLLMILGPIISGIGAVAGVIGPVIGLIAGGSGLTALVGGLGTALTVLTGPIGLVVAAVAALAAAWHYDWFGIKTTTLNAVDALEGKWSSFTTWLPGAWATAGEWLTNTAEATWDDLNSLYDAESVALAGVAAAGWRLMQGDADGAWEILLESAQDAFELLPDWAQDGIEEISNLFERFNWRTLGQDMVNGLISGVNDLWHDAVDTVQGLGQSMLDGFKDFFGISSPSTVFAEMGRNLMSGLEIGINAGGRNAAQTLSRWSDSIMNDIERMALAAQSGMGGVGGGAANEQEQATIFERMRSFAWGIAQGSMDSIWQELQSLPAGTGINDPMRQELLAAYSTAEWVRNFLGNATSGTSIASIQQALNDLASTQSTVNALQPGTFGNTTNNEYMIYLQQTGQLTTDLAGTIRLLNALFGG